MGVLDRVLPGDYQRHKVDGDRLLEQGEPAGARVELEAALGLLEDYYRHEAGILRERISKARLELYQTEIAAAEEARGEGDEAKAKECLARAVELAPDRQLADEARVRMELDPEAGELGSMGLSHRLGRLTLAVEAEPEKPEPRYNLGVELALDGYLEAAAEQFQQVIELAQDDAEFRALGYFRLANVYADLLHHAGESAGEPRTLALDHYQKALELGYDAADVRYRMGQVHELVGEHEEAGRQYLACLDHDGSHVAALSALAHCLEVEGRDEEALERLGKVIELDPEDAEAHFRSGAIRERSGDAEGASRSYRQALELDPDGEFGLLARTRIEELEADDRA